MQLPAPWRAALRARADLPPAGPRVPLALVPEGEDAPVPVGSVAPALIEALQDDLRSEGRLRPWTADASDSVTGWLIEGAPDEGLQWLARRLRTRGLCGPWRDELLAVHDARGRRVAVVERGAVRPLGITTQAVHLIGRTAAGRHWVQQRSSNKANDPGKLDTLMGGMVSAADTVEQALARETHEEAGLALSSLARLRHGGRVTIRRPSSQAEGLGWMHEHIDWFECEVPEGVLPCNQDGEVEAFHLLDVQALQSRLLEDAFTLEAALVISAAHP